MIASAISSAEAAEELGLAHDKIVLSCKASRLQEMVSVYESLRPVATTRCTLG